MMAWSLSGDCSSVSPAQVAPSSRANARSASDRAKTNTASAGISLSDHLEDQVAEAPKPVSPRFCPSFRPVNRSDR